MENVTTSDLVVRGSRIAFEWLDAETIVAQVGDAGRTVPYRFDVATGASEPLVSGEIVCNGIAIAAGHVAMVASERGGATEVYALEDGQARALTANGSEWLTAVSSGSGAPCASIIPKAICSIPG